MESFELTGGEEGYAASPGLVEYVVGLTAALAPAVNAANPAAKLSAAQQTNKSAQLLALQHSQRGGSGHCEALTAMLEFPIPSFQEQR